MDTLQRVGFGCAGLAVVLLVWVTGWDGSVRPDVAGVERAGEDPTPAAPQAPAPMPSTAVEAPMTIAFTGDILPHGPMSNRAIAYAGGQGYDYRPMFAPLRPVLAEADLALCHLEVPIHPPGESVTTFPAFGVPPEVIDAVAWAGYDGCSTASNHSLDRGVAGVTTTLDRMDEHGLGHVGTARSRRERNGLASYEVNGVTIAHLSYTYWFNGYSRPDDMPWIANPIEPRRIVADATRADRWADVVVVSLHWGTEGVHEPSADQRRIADEVLASDAIDLVVGHHAHVVQPIERVRGRWVAWGLGNLVSNQGDLGTRDGLVVLATVAAGRRGTWRVTRVEAIPTHHDRTDYEVWPIVPALSGDLPDAPDDHLRDDLVAAWQRTAEVLDAPDVAGLVLDQLP